MAKVTAKGSFHMLWGLLVSTVISAVGAIIIARLLGPDLYGLYAVALAAPGLIAVFRDWGVPAAITRFTAQYKAENRTDEIRSIFVAGLVFEVVLGLVLFMVSFVFSSFLATTVYNRPDIVSMIQIVSVTILAGGLVGVASAVFTGLERMKLNNIIVIVQAVVRVTVAIALVVAGLGALGAIEGYSISIIFAGLIGVMLIWTVYNKLPKPATARLELKAYIGMMLGYGVPLSVSSMISSFQSHFYIFLLPIYYAKDNVIIGNYGVAGNFIVLIGFFSIPITTMLFPAFSKLSEEKDKQTLQTIFKYSVKYSSLLVVPIAFLVICLAEPGVDTLFGNTYSSAPLFLTLISIPYLYTAFGNLSVGNLISSKGQTKFILWQTLLTAAVGIPLGFIFILSFGVLGLIATSLVSGIPSLVVGLRFVGKHYHVSVDWKSSVKILLSSAMSAAITYTVILNLDLASWILLIVGAAIFLAVFIPAILLSHSICRSDLDNLNNMAGSISGIGKILNVVLGFIEKAMDWLKL